jgi:hypothetical protein
MVRMSAGTRGSSISLRQRERTVASTRCGAWLTIRMVARAGGSSIVFSSALAPWLFRSSIASTMQTRCPPSAAVEPKKVSAFRTASTGIVFGAAFSPVATRSSTMRFGCEPAAI